MFQKLKTTLYHGSISDIEKIDVSMGRGRKDFGRSEKDIIGKSGNRAAWNPILCRQTGSSRQGY